MPEHRRDKATVIHFFCDPRAERARGGEGGGARGPSEDFTWGRTSQEVDGERRFFQTARVKL